jgi:antitoxin VapB
MAETKETGRPFEAAPAMRAKLFKHGGSQAVRLPKAFRFEGDEVEVRKEGDRVVLEPVRQATTWPKSPADWASFWARIDEIRGDEKIELHRGDVTWRLDDV